MLVTVGKLHMSPTMCKFINTTRSLSFKLMAKIYLFILSSLPLPYLPSHLSLSYTHCRGPPCAGSGISFSLTAFHLPFLSLFFLPLLQIYKFYLPNQLAKPFKKSAAFWFFFSAAFCPLLFTTFLDFPLLNPTASLSGATSLITFYKNIYD